VTSSDEKCITWMTDPFCSKSSRFHLSKCSLTNHNSYRPNDTNHVLQMIREWDKLYAIQAHKKIKGVSKTTNQPVEMVKRDTIVWVHPDQLASQSVSMAIANHAANAQSSTPQLPGTSSSYINGSGAHQSLPPQPQQSRWSVWDEVQLLYNNRNRQAPHAIQTLESSGYNGAALLLSLAVSLFPSPFLHPHQTNNITSSSDELTRPFLHAPPSVPKLLPHPTTTTRTSSGLVLKRPLKSDLEKSRGLTVIAHDEYWEEHERRHQQVKQNHY
jgi:hypothetical protein